MAASSKSAKVCLWQRGGPALQYVFGYQQGRAVFVDGAFGQAIDAPWLVAWPAYAGQFNIFLPHAFALAVAQGFPVSIAR